MGEFTEKFVKEASRLKPRVLITEGTNTAFAEPITEDTVGEKCKSVVKNGKGLVIADFGPRNLERLLIFLR
jgi:ribonuclease J